MFFYFSISAHVTRKKCQKSEPRICISLLVLCLAYTLNYCFEEVSMKLNNVWIKWINLWIVIVCVFQLLMFICGSKDRYRQLRDLHSLSSHMDCVKQLCVLDDRELIGPNINPFILGYDDLIALVRHSSIPVTFLYSYSSIPDLSLYSCNIPLFIFLYSWFIPLFL